MAGPLVMDLAARRGADVLPVDSEHSAIFQAMRSGARGEVARVVLTASGGPFRGRRRDELAHVSVDEALCHPTWRMGPKITVDSATLMNKALEVIEARWLFDLRPEQIEVIIHPESVIHSFVEFTDGSVLAQLSPPDMRLPIQYALTYPERVAGPARKLDWAALGAWHFEQPDLETFPALQLGYEVAAAGARAHGLEDRAVLAIDGQHVGPASRGQVHDQRAGHDQGFLVSDRDRLAGLERGPGAGQAGRADDGGDHHIHRGVADHFDDAVHASEQPGDAAESGGVKTAGDLGIRDGDPARAVATGLLEEGLPAAVCAEADGQ